MIVAQHNDNTVAARVTPSGHGGGGGAGRNPSNTTFTNNSSNNAAVDRHLLAYHLRDVPRALHNIQSLLDKAQKYVPKPIENNPVDVVMSEHKNDSGGKGESSGTAVSKKGVPSRSALPLQNAKKPVVASSNKNPSRPPGGLIPSKNVPPPAAAAQARRVVAAAASSTTATSATANRAVVGVVKSSSVTLSFQRSLSLPFSVHAPGAKSSSINQAQDGQTLKSNHVLLLQAYQRSATSISPAPHMTPSPSPAAVALQYYPDVADNAMITTTATTAHRLFDTTSVDDTTRGGAPRVTNRQHRAVQIPPSAGSSIPPARAGFGPATTMGTTKSWLTKTHAKGFLSSVLGIPQQQQQQQQPPSVSLLQISGAGTAAAPPLITTQGESTTSLATSSSSSLTLLQRIQQELANAPGRSGGLNTSVTTSGLAYGRSMSLNSTAYTAPHLSTSDTLSRSASINTHLHRRHYTQDTIFERLSSVGTEAHPLPTTSSSTLNHHTHQQQQAYSRTVSSASLGGCPAAVPPSSVAPAVSAAPADALWVGGLRPKTSKPAGAARPMVAPLRGVTIPAAPPSSIWGRLYGFAEKKIAQQQQQAAVEATTAAALQNQKSKSAAANLNHHKTSATVHQSVSAVVHRLYEKDIKQKEQQRAKKQQERELAEQQRLKRERDEIFNRAAKFREQAGAHFFLNQSTTAAPSTTTTHPMAIPTIPVAVDDALRPFSRQHSASRVHRDPAADLIQTGGGSQYQLIPTSGSYHKAATSTSGHAFDEDTDVEEEVVATHGADDAQSFVLTPYGTWHRKNSGAGGSGPVAASSSNNRSPLPLIVSATGGVGRSVVSPIDAKKSSRMGHIPHSRTSSYVSASSPAPPAVATTAVGVVDGGREELLDSRLSTVPPSRSGSVPPNPNLSQSTSNIAPLAAAPRPLRLDEDAEEDDRPQPSQPADKAERPHRPPKISKLDFSKLRKSKQ